MAGKRWLAALSAWAAAATLTIGGEALAQPSVYVQVAPPPPRHEIVRPARHGHVWVPGHWQWNGRRHVWIDGHYLTARPGWTYQPAQWVQAGGRWAYQQGTWVRVGGPVHPHGGGRHRDSDGDGVPDRYDRAPNNPHRR